MEKLGRMEDVELGPRYSLDVKGGDEHEGWELLKVLSNSVPALGQGKALAPSTILEVNTNFHPTRATETLSLKIWHRSLSGAEWVKRANTRSHQHCARP